MTGEHRLKRKISDFIRHQTIQTTTAISFSVVSVVCITLFSILLYTLFDNRAKETTIKDTEQLINQTSINLEAYLRNMRMVSDTAYYTVLKETDLADGSPEDKLNLLYESNKDKLVNIACFTRDGGLVCAVPSATLKKDIDVTDQSWFKAPFVEMENFHFSMPHVQNLFINTDSYRYYWVVSLSRAVELTRNGRTGLGVLVIDMNYNGIEQIFDRVNEERKSGYIYLTDKEGKIIYHPRQSLINSELLLENNIVNASYKDGSHIEKFNGEKHIVSVGTVSYTGWKIICVQPVTTATMSQRQTRYFAVCIVITGILTMLLLSRLIARYISMPLLRLTDSVRVEADGTLNPDIYIGGNRDVEYLGTTLKNVVEELRAATDAVVREQEEKRRSELDALQSQINPHFLYNTLDSIVWMIEGERYDDAVFMVTSLATLFRISLSRGRTMIRIEDEIKHAQNYMNIQNVRYKDKFSVSFDIDKDILDGTIVKLVLQPILENAIYYGMEAMDGDGEITVRGYKKDGDVYISVKDNGLGMTEDAVKNVLLDNDHVPRHGSGVGLINVHNRIKLRFGKEYGLIVESVPDFGTTVTIHIPYRTEQDNLSGKKAGESGNGGESHAE
ncbi:MAG: sensor histidine kinase [Lachnospiraceae bacterium]|nr:sensor histidine kinase [Lachnospiraceae bacterium]